MAGKLDEISRSIGSLETSVADLKRRFEESRELQSQRHADNSATLRALAAKLDQHAAAMAMIQPTVAALELSRSKLATFASVGLAAVVILGWIVEAGVKWTVNLVLAHFQ
jgi:aminoglycoside phosphotransferase